MTPFALVALGTSFLASTTNATRAESSCPVNRLCDACQCVLTSEPQHNVSCSFFGSSGAASYNLTLATYWADGSGRDGFGGGDVIAADEYRVTGPASGTPLSYFAELRLTGSVGFGCAPHPVPIGGSVMGSLKESDANQASASAVAALSCDEFQCCGGPAGVDTILSVPLLQNVGDVLTLTVRLSASAGHGIHAGVSGQLRFVGLPPGAIVTSCQGFRQDFPVSARSVSWGSLKVIYR